MGNIQRTLLQFESKAKSLDAENDDESPYVQDSDGNVYSRQELERQGVLSADDVDEDDYDYEYVIEEEVSYQRVEQK